MTRCPFCTLPCAPSSAGPFSNQRHEGEWFHYVCLLRLGARLAGRAA